VVIGVVCLVAALVGGGLKLVGDFPPITNPFVQVLVGLVGVEVNVSAYASSHTITGSVFTGSRIARWTGKAAPTAADCANLLSTHGIGETKFDRHDTFCLGAGQAAGS
jgi:hypothetical protein